MSDNDNNNSPMKGTIMNDKPNNLGDIESLINNHYSRIDKGEDPVYPTIPLNVPEAIQAPTLNPNLPIIGGHEDHDHGPIVVNEPYIIVQYGQNEDGEGAFSFNVAGIEGGILGAIGQLESTIEHLKEQVKLGNISTES